MFQLPERRGEPMDIFEVLRGGIPPGKHDCITARDSSGWDKCVWKNHLRRCKSNWMEIERMEMFVLNICFK